MVTSCEWHKIAVCDMRIKTKHVIEPSDLNRGRKHLCSYLPFKGIIRTLYMYMLKFLKFAAVVRVILYVPRVREKKN